MVCITYFTRPDETYICNYLGLTTDGQQPDRKWQQTVRTDAPPPGMLYKLNSPARCWNKVRWQMLSYLYVIVFLLLPSYSTSESYYTKHRLLTYYLYYSYSTYIVLNLIFKGILLALGAFLIHVPYPSQSADHVLWPSFKVTSKCRGRNSYMA